MARELLTETGSIFVQIGEENVHLVRSVLDEVLGSENYCSHIVFRKTTGKASGLLDNTYDVLLWYARDKASVKHRKPFIPRLVNEDQNLKYVELDDGSRRALSRDEWLYPERIPKGGRPYRPNPLTSQSASSTTLFEYEIECRKVKPGKGGWKTNFKGLEATRMARRLVLGGNTLT